MKIRWQEKLLIGSLLLAMLTVASMRLESVFAQQDLDNQEITIARNF